MEDFFIIQDEKKCAGRDEEKEVFTILYVVSFWRHNSAFVDTVSVFLFAKKGEDPLRRLRH